MKIYMLNAPFMPKSVKGRFVRCGRWQGGVARGGTLYYPIWLAYAAGVLEKEGHKVKLVDAVAWNWKIEEVINAVRKFKPDLIVVDSNFASLKNDMRVAKLLKNNIDGVITVIVGPPASQYPVKILENDGVDIAARFEYDFTVRDIAEAIVSLK